MLGPASGGIIVAVAGLGWLLVWPGEKTRNPFATYILTSVARQLQGSQLKI